jgi:threonylcarbamoyladenosine tRNA methylthiotransferase MtaB
VRSVLDGNWSPTASDGRVGFGEERTFCLVTLGCKANQYDSELVRESLLLSGFREAGPGEEPDLCVVNTCTVTHRADAEARHVIRQLARYHPESPIVVMGCYAAREPEVIRQLPGVAAVARHPDEVPVILAQFGVLRWASRITRFAGHHRAFVRIQDGCLLHCTYCIIPQVRPKLRTRRPEEIEAEVRGLVEAGYREIVLTGIHLGHYGLDLPYACRTRLSQLVELLSRIEGQWRLRLSSLDPADVQEELLEVMRSHPRICPHLHVCLQSGSDRVLKRMRRRYTVASFLRRVDLIRRKLEHPAITTDIIVGFPGETESDFQQTLKVGEEVGFSRVHIFPFSPRRGTPAAQMADQVLPEVVRDRRARLAEAEARWAERYGRSLEGRALEVLLERPVDGQAHWARGTACRYVEVRCPVPEPLPAGLLIPVRVQQWVDGYLVGVPEGNLPEQSRRLSWNLPVLVG